MCGFRTSDATVSTVCFCFVNKIIHFYHCKKSSVEIVMNSFIFFFIFVEHIFTRFLLLDWDPSQVT